MNRLLFLLPLVLLVLVSCSKEEEAPAPPPTPTYKLSFSADEGGAVSTEGGTYNQGSKITVTATPDGQYLFKEWSDGSTVNPREITVNADLTLKATFVKKTYPLSVTIDGEGTVQEQVIIQGSTTETEYNAGTTVRLTATANEGWEFSLWVVDGEVIPENPIEVAIEKGREATVFFKRTEFELNITIEGEGTVKEEVIVLPSQYDYETVVRLTAVPADGWEFSGWSGDVTSEENPIEVEVNQITSLRSKFVYKDILRTNFNTTGYSLLNHERNNGYYSSHSSQELTNILSYNFQNGGYGNIYVAVGIVYFDFNNDGLIDYLLKRAKDGKFFFIENMGNSYKETSLMKGGIDYYNKGARKIVYDDLNRDGYIDIIISAAEDNIIEERGLFILKGTPDGFEEIVISQGETEFFHSVTVGDVNNDGFGDIVIGARNFFYSFREDFSFEKIQVPTCWSCGMEYERAITHEMLDINNDGFSDLIVGYSNNQHDHKGSDYYNSTAIYYGTGEYPYFEKEYLLPSIYENANVTYDVSVIDFDGDGDLDIFSNTNNIDTPGYMIQYYENNGNGTFSNKTELVFENDSNINMNHYQIDWIKAFDIDGDGKLELMIEGQNWKTREDGVWGWLEPDFNGFKLNSNGKLDRFFFSS